MRTLFMLALLVTGISAAAFGASPLKITLSDAFLDVVEGDAVVLQYKYGEVPKKPYAMSWFTPKGLNVLRDAPHDHLHHHGLMNAITVEDINFWEESEAGGFQKHLGFSGVEIGEDRAAFTETLAWHGPGSTDTLLLEQRTLTHHLTGDGPVRLLTWRSMLQAPEGRQTVTLGGKIYHGVGMRFPEFMDKVGTFTFADDVTGGFEDGPHYLAQAAWCAYTVVSEGHTVTIAMFGAPDNPRPTLWFTMLNPFAYLSATLDLSRQPITLASDETVLMTFGVAVWDDEADARAIESAYTHWIAAIGSAKE